MYRQRNCKKKYSKHGDGSKTKSGRNYGNLETTSQSNGNNSKASQITQKDAKDQNSPNLDPDHYSDNKQLHKPPNAKYANKVQITIPMENTYTEASMPKDN